MTDNEIAELKRTVQERETQVAAQMVTLLALAEGGFDTSEVEAALRREADALTILRRYRASIVELRDE
ncbi:hypothetical protein ACIQW5_27855 [Methylorubrum thiocyanatum]|uniref:hypothetical protein n=1 Tax=Methylorubrum thiocyanatum TaxID=47958 RepID=UPI00383A1938